MAVQSQKSEHIYIYYCKSLSQLIRLIFPFEFRAQARLLLPLRFGAALAMAPWVGRLRQDRDLFFETSFLYFRCFSCRIFRHSVGNFAIFRWMRTSCRNSLRRRRCQLSDFSQTALMRSLSVPASCETHCFDRPRRVLE